MQSFLRPVALAACAALLGSCARFDAAGYHRVRVRAALADATRRVAPDGTAAIVVPKAWILRNLSHGDALVTGPAGETVRAGAVFRMVSAADEADREPGDYVLPYEGDVRDALPAVIDASLRCNCPNEPHLYVSSSRRAGVPRASAPLLRGLAAPQTWGVSGEVIAGRVVRRFEAVVSIAPPLPSGRWTLVVLRDVSAPVDAFRDSALLMDAIANSHEALGAAPARGVAPSRGRTLSAP